MKGKIQTVLGPINPEEAGFTLTHEHLLHDLPKSVFKVQPNELHVALGLKEQAPISIENLSWVRQYPYCFDDNIVFCDESTRSAVSEEMRFLKRCCSKVTIVENSSVGLRAKDQAEFLKILAVDSGVNIVLGTGFYVTGAQSSSTLSLTQEEMANLMKDDILKGVGRSEVKCGVIGEIGCSWPLSSRYRLISYITRNYAALKLLTFEVIPHPPYSSDLAAYDFHFFPNLKAFEKRSLVASATVQQETGCPVIIHPARNKNSPGEIIRLFQEAGGKIGKTVMSHLERTFFCETDLAEFASLGCYCEFDLFGTEVSHYQLAEEVDMPSDAQRVARLRYLVEQGYADKIVVSHDIHTKHRLEIDVQVSHNFHHEETQDILQDFNVLHQSKDKMKYGGHGYSHLYLNVLPKMLKRKFTEEEVKKIFFDNPSKWLAFE